MNNNTELYSLEVVRQLFLRQLAGEKLNHSDELYLHSACEIKHCKKMCEELKEIYTSPDMLALLRERPNSARWDEIVERLMGKDQEITSVDFLKPVIALFRPICNYFKKTSSVPESINENQLHS
ncbi:hypothetical protein [Chitinophaga sp. YIM B06452]|uniref:hypothetical protein n=1 Tax=Chitinophaga sp. YIM B06452 TaxID=3082158 RepID=UPI0031FF278F